MLSKILHGSNGLRDLVYFSGVGKLHTDLMFEMVYHIGSRVLSLGPKSHNLMKGMML